jgi:hypothetical protein
MNQSLITSLAILKVNFDNSRTYFDNFVPFVVESLRLQDEEIVSLPKLKGEVNRHFGLELPQNVLEKILRRTKKQGFLEIHKGIYKRVNDRVFTSNFNEIRQRMVEKHEMVIESLCSYCNNKFGHKEVSWNYDDAENAFNEYLIEHHYIVIKNIRANSPIKLKDSYKISSNFIVGSFIKDMQESYSFLVDYLEEVIKGHMIAKAIYFTIPENLNRRFRKTSVYIDTRFLVFALGYSGIIRSEPCAELIRLLQETGAELYCFRHTIGEITGILDTCKHKLSMNERRDTFGTLEYFVSMKMKPSDIEIEILRLEKRLHQEFNIRVIDDPDYIYKDNIDVKGLSDHLKNNVHYNSKKALENDVDSINSIMRLRRGHKTQIIEAF